MRPFVFPGPIGVPIGTHLLGRLDPGVFQAYNLSILLAALVSHAATGHLTAEVGWAAVAALPGTMVGAWFGAPAYTRLSDVHLHNVIRGLLWFSGLTLLWGV